MTPRRPSVAEALRDLTAELRAAGIDGPERDARHLLAVAAGWPRDRLTLYMQDPLADPALEVLAIMSEQRMAGRPVSRILGTRAFFGREFEVGDAVLDPRPETETLVIEALGGPFKRLLDLGTGSGCIAVSLLAERPQARGVATDISAPALRVAARNAQRHGVQDRLAFVRSDWCAAVEGGFDLILSNPPYIAQSEMAGLAREVREHDPAIALTDGADGLNAYRAIAAGAPRVLLPGGRLLVEIGPTQARAVGALFRAAGLDDIACHPDMDGRDRVIAARKPAT
ncbi:peptide chain release factor N(5)-glutamine methyltransferase [Oceaniglobus roseus]|uniref:peptide chain release factor N(5)-glutamine methyltransferase n=1 Tax=Oceaniglobus roseus TaxID=1737570 RepID=UPI000C7F2E98|nr:peptide chain release factor N(5)-glutamine methyltransferase [Kandeliimicrobium roseum]